MMGGVVVLGHAAAAGAAAASTAATPKKTPATRTTSLENCIMSSVCLDESHRIYLPYTLYIFHPLTLTALTCAQLIMIIPFGLSSSHRALYERLKLFVTSGYTDR